MSGFYIADMFAVSEKYLFVAYDRVDAELDDHEVTTYLLEEHDDKYTAIDIDIAPAFSSTARSMTNYHATLSHWHENENLSLITSSLATDIGILETETLQIYGQSEDINRAQFPLDEETGDDCSPVGFALSLHEFSSKVVEPCPGVDDVTGKLPRLYVLLHTGSLVSWWIFHKAGILNDTLSLQKAVEYSIPKEMEQPLGESLAAEVKQEEPKKVDNPFGSTAASAFGGFSTPKTANTSIAKSDSQTSQGPTLFGKTSAFGSSGFGSTGFGSSDSLKQRGTSAFGNTGFGSTSFGSSGFGSSGFGQTSSAAPSGFGQSGFGKLTMSASSGFAKFANSKNSIFGPNEKAESPFGDTKRKKHHHLVKLQNHHLVKLQNHHLVKLQNHHLVKLQNRHLVKLQNHHLVKLQNHHLVKLQNRHLVIHKRKKHHHLVKLQNRHLVKLQNRHLVKLQNRHLEKLQNHHLVKLLTCHLEN